MTSTNNSRQTQQQSSNNKPQQLKLTDYLRPVFQEAQLIREYCQFASIQQHQLDSQLQNSDDQLKSLSGLYVIPSAQSVHTWFGLLSISNARSPTSSPSPWNGANFRFFIKFPESFPTSPPTIYMAPISPHNPHHFKHITTHPDINSTTGQFNLRIAPLSWNNSAGAYCRVYKILKTFRKSFYKVEAPEHENMDDYLKRCAAEAADSVKFVGDVDTYLVQRFKGDKNLMLLGDNHREGQGQQGGGDSVGKGNNKRVSHLGLSFM